MVRQAHHERGILIIFKTEFWKSSHSPMSKFRKDGIGIIGIRGIKKNYLFRSW